MQGLLILVVLMSLASYRATRFILEDDLIETPRTKLKIKILAPDKQTLLPKNPFRVKLVDLLECAYCMSVWITSAIVLATWCVAPMAYPVLAWGATCGAVMAWWRLIEPD